MTLTKDDVLAAALQILDSYGLADLTMRRLGQSLGVTPGALYWHYANKQTLLASVAERILEPVATPAGEDWRRGTQAWAASLRAALLPHRDGAELVISARALGLAGGSLTDAPARLLHGVGLESGAARAAADTCLLFVLGHVAEEQALAVGAQLGVRASEGGHVDDRTFSFGIGLLLDGIGVTMAAQPPRDAPAGEPKS